MKKNTNQRLIVYTYLYSWQRIILQLAILDYKVLNGENINLYINQLAINETIFRKAIRNKYYFTNQQ